MKMPSFTGRNYNPSRKRFFASKPRGSAPKADIPGREIEVVITPEDFDHRVDRRNRPYAWVRGTLTYRRQNRFRTVMVPSEAYDLIPHPRSEERRVGKEGDSTCRSRWSPDY